jgi:hypothetical protein
LAESGKWQASVEGKRGPSERADLNPNPNFEPQLSPTTNLFLFEFLSFATLVSASTAQLNFLLLDEAEEHSGSSNTRHSALVLRVKSTNTTPPYSAGIVSSNALRLGYGVGGSFIGHRWSEKLRAFYAFVVSC